MKCYCLILGSMMVGPEVSLAKSLFDKFKVKSSPGEWRLELSGFRRDELPIVCCAAIAFP